MKKIDLSTWNRREHFEFFSAFEEPYFGLTFEVDVEAAYHLCKTQGKSFFLYYHFLATKIVNEIEPFRYRLVDDQPVMFDNINTTTTIMREDGTFSFSFIPFAHQLEPYLEAGRAEIDRIRQNSGIGMKGKASGLDVIHCSTIPWVPFKGLTHARAFSFKDSVPKISFGKITKVGTTRMMPVSVFVHHALADGYHVGQFYDRFQESLREDSL